jgi:hypothetical protein
MFPHAAQTNACVIQCGVLSFVKFCIVTDFKGTETYVFNGKQQLVCCDEMPTVG